MDDYQAEQMSEKIPQKFAPSDILDPASCYNQIGKSKWKLALYHKDLTLGPDFDPIRLHFCVPRISLGPFLAQKSAFIYATPI